MPVIWSNPQPEQPPHWALIFQIARMTNTEEMEMGGESIDFRQTLDALIEKARKLSGVDPGHEKVYCSTCERPAHECVCNLPCYCDCGDYCSWCRPEMCYP